VRTRAWQGGGACRRPAVRCDPDAGGGNTMPDAQALLIDLGGVVRRWNARRDARAEALGPLPAGALQRAAFGPALRTPAIKGAVTDEVWRARIVARLDAQYPGADAQAVVRSWSASPGGWTRTCWHASGRCVPSAGSSS